MSLHVFLSKKKQDLLFKKEKNKQRLARQNVGVLD